MNAFFKYTLIVSYTFCIVCSGFSNGKQGYIITRSNDTLWGSINYKGSIKDFQECQFTDTVKQKTTSYIPAEIKSYHIPGVIDMITTFYDGKNFFFDQLFTGKVNAYVYRDKSGLRYFLEKPGQVPLSEITEKKSREFYDDGVRKVAESHTHISQIYYYLNDCPEIEDGVRNLGSVSRRSLIRILSKYHGICFKNTETKKAILKDRRNSAMLEPVFGLVKYRQTWTAYPSAGIGVHLNIKQLSEDFFFKTGVEFHRINKNIESFTRHVNIWDFYKVPLQAEYIYTKNNWLLSGALGIDAIFSIENFFPFTFTEAYITENEEIETREVEVGSGLRTSLTILPSSSVAARYMLTQHFYVGVQYHLAYLPFKKDVLYENDPELRGDPEAYFGASQTLHFTAGFRF